MTTSPTTVPAPTIDDSSLVNAPSSGSTVDQVKSVFDFLGFTVTDERAASIAAEIESGQRNLLDVRNDLLQYKADTTGQTIEQVTADYIRKQFETAGATIATGTETEQERLDRLVTETLGNQGAGNIDTGRTFADILAGLQGTGSYAPGPTTEVQGIVLPSDVTALLKVTGQGGVGDEYYVQGNVFGQQFSFLVGDQSAFDAMFPKGIAGFSSTNTVTRQQFVNSDAFKFVAGNIDEIQGSTETLQGQIQRDLDALGLEALPTWLSGDPQAMLLLVTANSEGWSDTRLQESLSNTVGFKQRFVGFDQWYNQDEHGSIGDAIDKWIGLESQFTPALRSMRGRDTDTSTQYLGKLISSGWGTSEFTELLKAENTVKTNSAALDNLNEILAYTGQQQLSVDEMVDFFMKGEEFAGFETINDALRATALEDQGIQLSAGQYIALGEGSSLGVQSVGAFSDQARSAALGIAANFNEIQRNKLGVSNDLIVAVAFQDPDLLPKGTSLAQAETMLQQLGRERSALGQGTGGPTAYQDNQGRLRIQGLAG